MSPLPLDVLEHVVSFVQRDVDTTSFASIALTSHAFHAVVRPMLSALKRSTSLHVLGEVVGFDRPRHAVASAGRLIILDQGVDYRVAGGHTVNSVCLNMLCVNEVDQALSQAAVVHMHSLAHKLRFGDDVGDGIEFPWFAAIDGDELYVTDTGSEGQPVQVYNLSLLTTERLPSMSMQMLPWDSRSTFYCPDGSVLVRQWGEGTRLWTQGIAILDDRVFVVETGGLVEMHPPGAETHYVPFTGIAEYSKAGEYERAWPVFFGEPGVNGVAIAAIGRELFVTNPRIHAVQVFDPDGTLLRQIGSPETVLLSAPCGICQFHRWVCISSLAEDGVYVCLFWPDGRLVRKIHILEANGSDHADSEANGGSEEGDTGVPKLPHFCFLSSDADHVYASCSGTMHEMNRLIVLRATLDVE